MSDFSDKEDVQIFQLAKQYHDQGQRIDWKSIASRMYNSVDKSKCLRGRLNTLKKTYGKDLDGFPFRFQQKTSSIPRYCDHIDKHDIYLIISKMFEHVTSKDVCQVGGKAHLNCGELHSSGVTRLLNSIEVSDEDVFMDIGCGIANVLVQVVLESKVQKCLGVEIRKDAVLLAEEVISRHINQFPQLSKIRIIHSNFNQVPLIHMALLFQTTILYTSNLLFDPTTDLAVQEFISHAKKLRYVFSFQKFCPRHRSTCSKLICRKWSISNEVLVRVCWSDRLQLVYVYRKTIE
jgi:hypothetical protein